MDKKYEEEIEEFLRELIDDIEKIEAKRDKKIDLFDVFDNNDNMKVFEEVKRSHRRRFK